jgi:tetratricopeptide (TPR) repeat protein
MSISAYHIAMPRHLLVILSVQVSLTCAIAQDACRDRYRSDLEGNPKSSLAHFHLAECYFEQKNRVAAVNEYRAALNGDLKPSWIEVWSHINMGKEFDATGQRERALNEYRSAEETKDNTRGAQDEVAKYRQSPYRDH